jgi:WD40 repeat protein
VLFGHEEPVRELAFSPDGRLLASASGASGKDNVVRIWKLPMGQLCWELKGHTHRVCCLAFSPNGRLLATGSFDQTVRLWNLDRLRTVGLIEQPLNHLSRDDIMLLHEMIQDSQLSLTQRSVMEFMVTIKTALRRSTKRSV